MNQTEILAPVGSTENLEAAVLAGADAVYLAGKNFGARSFAENFTREQLIEVIKYCHIRDVSVYITVNTLIKENEILEVMKYIDFLYINGVDALIVQDIGLASIILKRYPDLDLHASTQMTAHSLEDVRFLETMGFKRVILSREVSIEEIRKIKNNTNIELEVFVHGALCVSYSGQCLMSSLIGGRSGNRGKCAQPCRKLYQLKDKDDYKKEGYLLSLKDLSVQEEIHALKALGITSLKIEGRMKSKNYVYSVVSTYKNNSDEYELSKVFNRYLTKGFLFDTPTEDMSSEDTPGHKGSYLGTVESVDTSSIDILLADDLMLQDEIQIRRDQRSVGARIEKINKKGRTVDFAKKGNLVTIKFTKQAYVGEEIYKTYDVAYNKAIDLEMNEKNIKIPLSLEVTVKIGEKPMLSIVDNHNNHVETVTDFVIEKAAKRPVSKEQIIEHISKLGSTPYSVGSIKVICDDEVFLPISRINELRRIAVDQLNEQRKKWYNNRQSNLMTNVEKLFNGRASTKSSKELFVSVDNLDHLAIVINDDVDGIYYRDLETFEKAKAFAAGENIYLSLDTITDTAFYESFEVNVDEKIQVKNVGQIGYFKKNTLTGGFPLNVYNSIAANFYNSKGINQITVSPELTLDEINDLATKFESKIEAIIYGKIPVMTTKYNIAGEEKNLSLEDRFNDVFDLNPVNSNLLEVLDANTIFLLDHYRDLMTSNIDVYSLYFTNETMGVVKDVLDSHIKLKNEDIDKEFIVARDRCKEVLNVSKGHFYTGVE